MIAKKVNRQDRRRHRLLCCRESRIVGLRFAIKSTVADLCFAKLREASSA